MALNQYAIENWRTFSIPSGEGYMDGSVYTDPTSEEVRPQMQSQLSQIKNFLNTEIVPNVYTKAETQQAINDAVISAGGITEEMVDSKDQAIKTSIIGADPDAFTVLNLNGATIKVSDSLSFTIEVV